MQVPSTNAATASHRQCCCPLEHLHPSAAPTWSTCCLRPAKTQHTHSAAWQLVQAALPAMQPLGLLSLILLQKQATTSQVPSVHPLVVQPYSPVIWQLPLETNLAPTQFESVQRDTGQGSCQRVSVALHAEQVDVFHVLQIPHVPGSCSHGRDMVVTMLRDWERKLPASRVLSAVRTGQLPVCCMALLSGACVHGGMLWQQGRCQQCCMALL